MLNLVSHGLRNTIDSRESNESYLWHILRNMIDHRSYAHNLSSCEIKVRKKIRARTGSLGDLP